MFIPNSFEDFLSESDINLTHIRTYKYSLSNLDYIINDMLDVLLSRRLIYMFGDLGSGKTTIAKKIVKKITGSDDIVSSPTFNIIHEYQFNRYQLDNFGVTKGVLTDESVINKSVTDKLITDGLVVNESVTDRSTTNRTVTDGLVTDKLVTNGVYKKDLIYHVDLYRIKSIKELEQIGVYDLVYSNRICIIEWPYLLIERMKKSGIIFSVEILGNSCDSKIGMEKDIRSNDGKRYDREVNDRNDRKEDYKEENDKEENDEAKLIEECSVDSNYMSNMGYMRNSENTLGENNMKNEMGDDVESKVRNEMRNNEMKNNNMIRNNTINNNTIKNDTIKNNIVENNIEIGCDENCERILKIYSLSY